MKKRFVGTAASSVLVSMMVSAPAGAVERQHHLGAGGGIALLKVDDKSTMSAGGMGSLHYAYGFSDAFNLVAEGGYSLVALGEEKGAGIPATRPAGIGHLGAGATYVLDVIQWVPYIGLLGTGYTFHGGSIDGVKGAFGATVAVGLDYQLSRSFAFGLAGRQHVVLSALSTYPTFTEGFVRFEVLWGW